MLKDVKLFMLDMDGTFYLEDRLLPGALEFLEICRKQGIGFTFLTNNSSKNAQAYLDKLERLGVKIGIGEMLTSGDATLLYLEENKFGKELLLIGTKSLEEQFAAQGYDLCSPQPKAVVLGFDTSLDYAKLTALCNGVRSGLPYIATHPDFNCPVEGGYIPDIGATIAYVEAATGRRPDVVIGKPNGFIAKAAARRAGLKLEELCMVGDRLYTDIALGRSGVKTVLVLCGESTREDLEASGEKPDYVFENLLETGQALLAGV